MIYEESLRMPFAIRYPKEINSGSSVNELLLNIDFPALFPDYAGIEKPAYIEGSSFRNMLKGQPSTYKRKEFYYRYWQHLPVRPAHFGIRDERYKLAFFYGQALDMKGIIDQSAPTSWEFYNLQVDPKEQHNAYSDASYRETIEGYERTTAVN